MIQPNTPLAVTLPAERWNQVIALLSEVAAPHRVTDPLIREIQTQCLAADKPNVKQLHEAGC